VRRRWWKLWRAPPRGLLFALVLGMLCRNDSITAEGELYPPWFSSRWIRRAAAPPDLAVDLNVTALVRGGEIELTYWLINRTEHRYAVFNHLAPGEAGDADAVQIDFTGTALLLSKQVPPWPEMVSPHYDAPAQSILEARGQLSQRFNVPLPVTVNNDVRRLWLRGMSGGKLRYTPTALRKTKRVALMIGIALIRPEFQATEYVRAPGVFSVEGMDPEVDQLTLARTVVLPDTIEVLDYEGKP